MKLNFEKSDKILLLICAPFIIWFASIVWSFKYNGMPKEESIFYGSLAFLPIFLSFLIYSLVTEKSPASGLKIGKDNYPKLHFFITLFWGLMSVSTVICLFITY